jgi:hypothetical protein
VEVVGHQAPGEQAGLGGHHDPFQAVEEVVAVGVVGEEGAALDATGDDVVQGVGGIEA